MLYWNLDGVSILTAADMCQDYAPYAYHNAQVLKLAHHGAKSDNERDILSLVSPQVALITASEHRSQPYQAALTHLDALGARALVTGQTGAITLRIQKGNLHIITHGKDW